MLSTTCNFFLFLPLSFYVRNFNNRGTFLVSEATHFRQVFGLNDREIIEAEEPLGDQLISEFIADTRNARKRLGRTIQLFVQFLLRHDLNVPADEFRSQSHILTAFPDGQ